MADDASLKDIIHILKKQCLVHMFLQSKSANIHHFINNTLTIPNIVIGGIMSVTIFSTSNYYWKIATGALAITSTILSTLSKHLSSGERAHAHCSMVKEYMTLLQDLNISVHSTTEVEERKKIIAHVRDKLHYLYDSQPEPSTYAVSLFEKRFKRNIEAALFDDFENMVLQDATYVQNRLSFVKQKRTSREAL